MPGPGVVVPPEVAQLGFQQLEMRKKIALAMMAQKRKPPKNMGEGLSAVGNAIGDNNAAQMLLQQQAQQDAMTRQRMLEEDAREAAAREAALRGGVI